MPFDKVGPIEPIRRWLDGGTSNQKGECRDGLSSTIPSISSAIRTPKASCSDPPKVVSCRHFKVDYDANEWINHSPPEIIVEVGDAAAGGVLGINSRQYATTAKPEVNDDIKCDGGGSC